MKPYDILILGASYGSLIATKLLFGSHRIKLVCLPNEAEIINREGTRVRMPVKGRAEPVDIESRMLPGQLSADEPGAVDPAGYDLVVLAMQEPQFRAPAVRELLDRVARAARPTMSIMNMPPLAYLRRIPGLDAERLRPAYTDASVWDPFDPSLMTLCSPDPQAFRPTDQKANFLQVTLPTNFKAARFTSDAHTAILQQLQEQIEAVRWGPAETAIELPVKLKVHQSIFVPLAKWAMLLTGNYRCVTPDGVQSIRDAVHLDLGASRAVYDWVVELCIALGAARADLVPFEKYAAAAESLVRPSSAARALVSGAAHIERVDRLVQLIAAQKGMQNPAVDRIVRLVDAKLEANCSGSPSKGQSAARKSVRA